MQKKIINSVLTCCLMLSLLPSLTISTSAANINSTDISSLVNTANGAIGKTATQLGLPTSGWCGYFVGYCINNSTIASKLGQIPSDACSLALSPIYWVCNTKNTGTYYSISSIHGMRLGEISETFKNSGKMISVSSNTFKPEPGDLVEFTWQPWNIHEFSHIGIVTEINGNNITYVDGNSKSGKGKVASHIKLKTDASIIGYIRLDQSIDDKFVVSDGAYTLTPKCAPDSRLDVANGSTEKGANIQIHQANNTEAQQFEFKYLGEGYYQITSKVSGKSLDVQNGNNKSGANVWQYDSNSTDAQKWMLEKVEDGYYHIVPKLNTNLCLDVYNAKKDNGTNVQVWSKNQSDAQKWKLTSVQPPVQSSNPLPTNLTVSTDKSSYVLGESVLITPSANNATHYAISVWKGTFGTGDRVYVNFKIPGRISFNPTQAGTYTIRVDAKNGAGYISTEKTFTVTAAAPSEPTKQKAWGNWSNWSTDYVESSDTRQVETTSVKVADPYMEYRYGRYIDSTGTHVCWCKKYLEGLRSVSGSALLQYSEWSAARYNASGKAWTCGYCGGDHTGIHHASSDGRAWWAQFDLPSGSYYWEESRNVDARYEARYRYRDLI